MDWKLELSINNFLLCLLRLFLLLSLSFLLLALLFINKLLFSLVKSLLFLFSFSTKLSNFFIFLFLVLLSLLFFLLLLLSLFFGSVIFLGFAWFFGPESVSLVRIAGGRGGPQKKSGLETFVTSSVGVTAPSREMSSLSRVCPADKY